MFHRDKRDNFYIALRIVRKRTLEEIAAAIPQASSELVALRKALKSLGFTKKDDDDVVMDDIAMLSLRCPISGQQCRMPARLAGCVGFHAFDAESFLQLNTVSRKWCCPECGKKGGPTDLRVDSFIKNCVEVIRTRGLEKAGRIEINKDGMWRPREDPGALPLPDEQMRWYVPIEESSLRETDGSHRHF
jgi:E3 SUMO-protein ligase PIAS1